MNPQKLGLSVVFLAEATFGGWFCASTGPTALGVIAAVITVISLVLFTRYFFPAVA